MRYAYAVRVVTETIAHLVCIHESQCRKERPCPPPHETTTRGTELLLQANGRVQRKKNGPNSVGDVLEEPSANSMSPSIDVVEQSNACKTPARGVAAGRQER